MFRLHSNCLGSGCALSVPQLQPLFLKAFNWLNKSDSILTRVGFGSVVFLQEYMLIQIKKISVSLPKATNPNFIPEIFIEVAVFKSS